MATFKYRLRTLPNSDGQTDITIYLFYTHNQRQHPFPTGEKVKPDNWDAENEKVTAKQKGKSTEINDRLTHYKAEGERAVTKARLNGIDPDIAYMKSVMADVLPSKKKKQPEPEPQAPAKDFFAVWQEIIDYQKSIGKLAYNTIRSHQKARNKVLEICKVNGVVPDLKTINQRVWEKIEAGYIKDNASSGTIATDCKNLKVFLNWAKEQGYPVNEAAFEIKKPKAERATITVLEAEHLEKLEKAQLPEQLVKHRDLFLFTCYTGLRYSDLANIRPEDIKGDLLRITTEKTNEEIWIPLIDKAKAILNKYMGNLPSPITNQKMNFYLKEIGLLAGLTDKDNVTSYTGGKTHKTTHQKYELLTCHVARRTFIVQSLQKGMKPAMIMAITGHKDIRVFYQYVKIADKTVKEELFKAWN